MTDEAKNKGIDDSGTERQERAASVNEHLRAAKAEILSSTSVSSSQPPSSLKFLFIGIGAIALAGLLWMAFGGGKPPVEAQPVPTAITSPAVAPAAVEHEPSAALVEARERARQARERIRAAEELAQQARERRLALEAEQVAQRAREAEQARREAEELSAALATAKEANQRMALEARQAQVRREAEERVARAERERQTALAAQQAEEEHATREAEEVRQGLGGQMTWGVDL